MRLLRGIDILLPRLLRLLLECMQDVDGIFKRSHVNHPILSLMHDADLPNAGSDRRHRFPIGRLQSVLNPIQLIAGVTLGSGGKPAKPIEGAATESDILHAQTISLHADLFKYRYIAHLALTQVRSGLEEKRAPGGYWDHCSLLDGGRRDLDTVPLQGIEKNECEGMLLRAVGLDTTTCTTSLRACVESVSEVDGTSSSKSD